jgi:hypothetical protein
MRAYAARVILAGMDIPSGMDQRAKGPGPMPHSGRDIALEKPDPRPLEIELRM